MLRKLDYNMKMVTDSVTSKLTSSGGSDKALPANLSPEFSGQMSATIKKYTELQRDLPYMDQ